MTESLRYTKIGTLKLARGVINTFCKDLRKTVKKPSNKKTGEAELMVNLFFSSRGLSDMWCGLAEIDEFALRKEANEILKGEKRNG